MSRILAAALTLALLATSCCDPQRTGQQAATGTVVVAPGGFASGALLTLRNSEGRFVSVDQAAEGDTRNVLRADRDTADALCTFTLEVQADGRIGLRSPSGKYVCADRDKGGLLTADRDYVGDWESFELIPATDGKFSLRTSHGKYVTADLDAAAPLRGRLIADRDEPGAWEQFTVEAAMLP